MWRARSSSTSGTILTIVENVGTFTTSNVTYFANFFTLMDIWEMVLDTWTFWDWVGISSTNSTVTV